MIADDGKRDLSKKDEEKAPAQDMLRSSKFLDFHDKYLYDENNPNIDRTSKKYGHII